MNIVKIGFSFVNRSGFLAPRVSPSWNTVQIHKPREIQTSPPENQTNLAPGQVVITENDGKKTLLSDINKQIREDGTGRLFSVIYLRGKQHKVTPGMKQKQF